MKNLFSHAALLVLSILLQGPVASASSGLPEHPATHPNVVSVDALNGARHSPSTPRQPLPPELARAATHPDELGVDWFQIAPGVWERNAATGLVDRTIFGADGHRWLAGHLEVELDDLYAIAEDANDESNLWERIDLKEAELAHAQHETEHATSTAAASVTCSYSLYAGPYGGSTPGSAAQSFVTCSGNTTIQPYDQACANGICNTFAPPASILSYSDIKATAKGTSGCSAYAAVAVSGVSYYRQWSGACGGTPPSLTASPTTVQVLAGQSAGSTTLSWNAPGYGSVSVYVSTDGAPQVRFATSTTSGSATASWIEAGHQYVFRLYPSEDTTKVLASATVTGRQATIAANPATVMIPAGQSMGSTTLSWNATGYSSVSVYVIIDGADQILFANDKAISSAVVPWIYAGHRYEFRLYPEGKLTTLLASVTVTGALSPVPDLYGILMNGTGTKTTEVHSLSGTTNYQQFVVQTGTPLEQSTRDGFAFDLGDYDRDGKADLFIIKMNGTGTGTTEVSIFSGASGYQQALLHTGTALDISTRDQFAFEVADYNRDGVPDLYAIKMNGTAGTLEVHVLSGAAGYRQFALQSTSALGQVKPDAFAFDVGDYNRDGVPDLYCIAMNSTGSGSSEMHILSGAGNFQSFLVHAVLPVGPTSRDQWNFTLADYNWDGIPDLYLLPVYGTGTGKVEAHVVSGAGFASFLLHAALPAPTATSSQWWWESY